MKLRLGVVLLAAGESRRLGRPKQFVKRRGVSLLQKSIENTRGLGDARVIVAGAHGLRLRRTLSQPRQAVTNPDWASGMRSSVTVGLAALPPHTAAALIVPCDLPQVRRQDLRRLVDRWRDQPNRCVAARYRDTLGVPVVVPKRFWSAMLAASGPDTGAGPWLRQSGRRVVGLPLARAADDVDRVEDL